MDELCTVVAFDPGETTGWCILQVKPETLLGGKSIGDTLHRNLVEFECGEIQCLGPKLGWTSAAAAMENDGVHKMLMIADEYFDYVVVMEDFILDFNQATMTRSSISPVSIMAKFEYGFHFGLWGNVGEDRLGRIFRQSRTIKATCSDDRLKEWNLFDRNSGRHARDATRHAYYFLRDCRGNTIKAAENRWRAWPQHFPDPMAMAGRGTPVRKRPPGERIPGLG